MCVLFSASNFAHSSHMLTVYRACSSCMNPRAGPECKNFACVLAVHELWTPLSPGRCKIMALSRLMCLLRSAYLPGPETKTFRP